jgi:hypothetical protein
MLGEKTLVISVKYHIHFLHNFSYLKQETVPNGAVNIMSGLHRPFSAMCMIVGLLESNGFSLTSVRCRRPLFSIPRVLFVITCRLCMLKTGCTHMNNDLLHLMDILHSV